MTASQLHTLPIPPMFTGSSNSRSSSASTNPVNSRINNIRPGLRAKKNLFGTPCPIELRRICEEENNKKINEIKDKYKYDLLNDRIINNNNENNNNNNENDESEITTTTITTTPTTQTTSSKSTTNNIITNELNVEKKNNYYGQDEQNSNIIINNLLNNSNSSTTTTVKSTATEEIINNNNNKSTIIIDIPKSVISKNFINDSECDVVNNENDNNDVGKSNNNNNKLINNNNKNSLFNKSDVIMCNQINSTTISSSSSPIIINSKDKIRFTPYKKQCLITDMLKVRKADMTRPQKGKLHFDETTDQQQQPQEQHLTINEV